jgi:hypothetical protein
MRIPVDVPHMRWAEVKENQFSACSVSVTSSSLSWKYQDGNQPSEYANHKNNVNCAAKLN